MRQRIKDLEESKKEDPKENEEVKKLKTELSQKDQQIVYLTKSFNEYREYAEEKMKCKSVAEQHAEVVEKEGHANSFDNQFMQP